MNKISKLILTLMLAFSCACMPSVVMAQEGQITTETVEKMPDNEKEKNPVQEGVDKFGQLSEDALFNDVVDTDVTLDSFGEKVINKIWEGANILQRIGYGISVIGFILGSFLIIFGALSKRMSIGVGIIACISSAVAFTLCMYAPQIIQAVSTWLVS